MFKVGNLRIRFKHFKYVDAGFEENKIGKFGVTCSVYLKDGDTPLFQGTVRPYYKDQPDRILGKKYALREALVNKRIKRKSAGEDILSTYIVWNFTKTERTEIWNAFWEWVESWDKKPHPTLLEACLAVQRYYKATLGNRIPPDEANDYWESVMSIVNEAVRI